ncbi:MAG: hypothetical protein PHI66_05415 [Candidatus Pacebacteria bacterium]|nr:hypothetical protein [Candidatus Paceibacterota bacterium]
MSKKIIFISLLVFILVFLVVCFKGENESKLVLERDREISDQNEILENSDWADYISLQGIYFKYPKEAIGVGCGGEKNVLTPVRVIEDVENGYIYLTVECSASLESLRDETRQVSIIRDGYKQEKFFYGWNIAIESVLDDDDMEDFINKHYGSGSCEAGEKKLVERREGMWDVNVTGKDWGGALDMESDCVVNYSYKIFSRPEKNRALSVVLGQECTFAGDMEMLDCYDDDIVGSILFN